MTVAEYDILFTKNYKEFQKIAIGCANGKDILAEDVLHDSFIKGRSAIETGRYEDRGKFLPWMRYVIQNITFDKYRKQIKEKRFINFDVEQFDIMDHLVSDENIEEDLMRKESVDRIKKLLQVIPQVQKEVLEQRIEGVMFRDIAESAGISINTALGRSRYATLNIRKLL